MSYNFCFSVSKEFPVRAKVHVIFEQPSYMFLVFIVLVVSVTEKLYELMLIVSQSDYTYNPLYTDTQYNDKIRYNDNLTVTKFA